MSILLFINTLIALIGAGAWAAPYVYSKLSSPKIIGKLISYAESQQYSFSSPNPIFPTKTLNGICYFLKLSIASLQADCYFNQIDISILFEDESCEKCELFYHNPFTMNFNGTQKSFDIPQGQHLLELTLLPKDKNIYAYVSFIAPVQYKQFKTIYIDFVSKKKYRFEINKNSSNSNHFIYEKANWK